MGLTACDFSCGIECEGGEKMDMRATIEALLKRSESDYQISKGSGVTASVIQ